MIRTISILILCVAPLAAQPEAKTRIWTRLEAMNNIIAMEEVRRGARTDRYPIAVEGRSVRSARPYRTGLYVDQAWYSLLADAMRWQWEPEGPHFTYKDHCSWRENVQLIRAPCAGEVFVVNGEIRRITQRLSFAPGHLFREVAMVIDYDYFQLSEPRLLPSRMTLEGDGQRLAVAWTGYREFRASAPELVEIDGDDGYTAPSAAIRNVTVEAASRSEEPRADDAPGNRFAALPLVPARGESGTARRPRRWWRRLLP